MYGSSFYLVEFRYVRYENRDCLFGKNLLSVVSSRDSDYENCKQWCVYNTTCGGFAGTRDGRYFKRLACKDDVFTQANVHLYLKEIA